MFIEERQREIIREIKSNRRVFITELSKKFSVSLPTVRRDLDELAGKNLVKRTHGGAILIDTTPEIPFEEREAINIEEKKKIGEYAAGFVNDGDTIILDAGTTTYQMALALRDKEDIFVLTNSIKIGLELMNLPKVTHQLIGGNIKPVSLALIGPSAVENLSNYRVNKLFLGINGISLEKGFTVQDPAEAEVKKKMIEISDEVIVVADSSKIGKISLVQVAGIESAKYIITDSNVDQEYKNKLESSGVKTVTY